MNKALKTSPDTQERYFAITVPDLVVRKPSPRTIKRILKETSVLDNDVKSLNTACFYHLSQLIEESKKVKLPITWGELSDDALSYSLGYLQCLVDFGLHEPDNLNTFYYGGCDDAKKQ